MRDPLARAARRVHRTLGTACAALIALWFASGIAMTWVAFPAYDARERLAYAPPLALDGGEHSAIPPRLSAWLAGGGLAQGARPRLSVLADRPTWVWNGRDGAREAERVDAQGGREPDVVSLRDPRLAREVEQRFGAHAIGVERLERGDQWTSAGYFRQWDPLLRVALDDGAGTLVYVSERSFEVVQRATQRERLLAWLGPIPHWLYFPWLRRDGALWSRTLISLATLSWLVALSGLITGLARQRRLRRSGGAIGDPYLRLHQRIGLGFGLFASTWLLSGALTLQPFDWSGGTSLRAREQRALHRHALADPGALPVAAALARCAGVLDVRELELSAFAGRVYAVCSGADAQTRIVDLLDPELTPRLALDPAALARGAQALAGERAIAANRLLRAPDAYHYPTHRTPAIALPYARIELSDADATAFYLDPARAAVLARHSQRTRIERWLRSGLHSLDLPILYARPALWRSLVIAAMVAGLLLSGLGLLLALRRLRRAAFARVRARGRALPGAALIALLSAAALPGAARAETLLAVVSETSAPQALEGAHQLLDAHPGHTVLLRTPEQLERLDDAALAALLVRADAILIANVFGDFAQRLSRLLKTRPPAADVPLIALGGDVELTRASRIEGRELFAGLPPDGLTELSRGVSSGDTDQKPWSHWAKRYPQQAPWIQAYAYWSGRAASNVCALLAWLLARAGAAIEAPPPAALALSRYVLAGKEARAGQLGFAQGAQIAVLLDYQEGDSPSGRALHARSCQALAAQGLGCVSVLSRWGRATADALDALARDVAPARVAALVALQDFVLGGGEERERATRALLKLNVPVIKAMRLVDRGEASWRLSSDGLPWDSVHYRLSMPELQGIGEATVVEAAGREQIDARTGLSWRPAVALEREIDALAARIGRWRALQAKPNADKKVAVIYYNHPPGRHNIGADNLDVPESLWEILHALKAAGYTVGELPRTSKELLARMQRDGVNLPESRAQLAQMGARVASVSEEQYARYFASLPEPVQRSVARGPLARLALDVEQALAAGESELGRTRVTHALRDVRHVLEGSRHPARKRALGLLVQLEAAYTRWLGDANGAGAQGTPARAEVQTLTDAIVAIEIEGVRGWGAPPGRGMVTGGKLIVPGLRFGNVFVGPQPPRGWELDEELLHANLSFAPPHQYLAAYHYLRDEFGADALVHVGRHSTYEFLPGPSAGLSRDDFSRLIVGPLPSVYLYIVDGVGEGLAAKRRGAAVIVDHLTPPLASAPLYDELLVLRQLVESYEAASGAPDAQAARARAVQEIRAMLVKLKLEADLRSTLRAELHDTGLELSRVSDDLLVHEVGHYLTELQERFMPFGLHVFGRAWSERAVERMLTSIGPGENAAEQARIRSALVESPGRERSALLAALAGGYIEAGHGNDPIRRPEVLPTGRNFHALDGGLLPTRVAYALGAELASSARAKNPGTPDGSESVVLWASDTVRDEGVMVAFGLDMLGVRPLWNSRGILRGLQRVPLTQAQPARRDVSFVTSGLFRDLYEALMIWLDRAVLLALDGASQTIAAEHPALVPALEAALAPLGELRAPGSEPLAQNQVAAHWVAQASALIATGTKVAEAGPTAAVRLFGNAPGGYGAGVNTLVERSGAWADRSEVATAFAQRMGHGYSSALRGAPLHASFAAVLARTERTFLGRASHLYGLLDNNDGFDYLGGLRMAVERERGRPPDSQVVQYADDKHARVEPIDRALFSELRGRHLNPEYLKSLMAHGYAGARTMSSGFVENLWGWQVTSPDLVEGWVWDEVNSVFLDDRHGIGLAKFLEQGDNVHVKANLEAILLVAADKGFWDPGEAKLSAIARDFAKIVVEHGLPGSGHTRPDHPVMRAIAARLPPEQRTAFQKALDSALQPKRPHDAPTTVSELQRKPESAALAGMRTKTRLALALLAFALLGAGFVRGRRKGT